MAEQEQVKQKMIVIRNHGKGDLVLGARFVRDSEAGDYERAAEAIPHGKDSKPMTAADFKFYDVPALAEKFANDELELFVDGVSKRRAAPAPRVKPQSAAEALAPTESAESAESRELASLLGGGTGSTGQG